MVVCIVCCPILQTRAVGAMVARWFSVPEVHQRLRVSQYDVLRMVGHI